jgi:predicted AAA+ superfamily ATPase
MVIFGFTDVFSWNISAQHLSARKPLAYWKRENNLTEIDFLLERDGIVSVEIKAGKNPQSRSS